MRNLLLMLLSLCFICYPTIAQDFPDGLIAYIPAIECELLVWCTDGIKIINPNTGESKHIQTDDNRENMVNGESLSWSPDQRYMIYLTYDLAHIMDVTTGEDIGTIEFYFGDSLAGGGVWYDWHPTAPLIVFVYQHDFESELSRNYDLFIFDLLEQTWLSIVEDIEHIQPYFVEWSPDGQSILFEASATNAHDEKDIYLYDVLSSDVTNLTNAPDFYGHPVFSEEGSKIVYTRIDDQSSQIIIIDTHTFENAMIYEHKNSFIGRADWILDESAILFWMKTEQSDYDIELYLLDLHTNDIDLVTAIPRYFSGYDISPDKTALVYLASEEHEKDVCIVSLITFEETCLEGEKAYMVSYPAWGN